MKGDCRACGLSLRSRRRRRLLQAFAGLGLGLQHLADAGAVSGVVADDGDTTPPQEGDWLVFAAGDRAGGKIAVEDLMVGAQQLFAFPQDPATGKTRNGTRLNQVLVVRLDPVMLSAETLARSVQGVVAYSAVCSHAGCDVTDWYSNVRHFKCPCHESEYDPSDGARVVTGPAPWQLAALPLRLTDGKLAAAGGFEGRVGFLQPGQDPFGL